MSLIARARAVWSSGGARGLASATRAHVAHHPTLVRALVSGRYQYYRRVEGYRALADPFAFVEVDPNSITASNRDIDKYLATGAIRGGDWDRNTSPYEESLKYRSVEQRFLEGRDWNETAIHEELRRRIEDTGEADGCYSVADLERRYDRIDRLYESIETDGYDPTQSYETSDSRISNSLDQVCISVGRDGELLFCGGGNHRFSIAKVLGLESIPVRVVVRHAEWQRHRDRIASGEGTLEKPEHPDLADVLEEERS